MGIEIRPPLRLETQKKLGPIRRWLAEYQPILKRRKLYKGSVFSSQVLPPGVTIEEAIRVTAESPWAKGWAEGIARMAGYTPGTPEYEEQVKRLSHFVAERLWRG